MEGEKTARPSAGAFPVLSQMGAGLYGIQRDSVGPLVCSTHKSGTVSTEAAPSSARTHGNARIGQMQLGRLESFSGKQGSRGALPYPIPPCLALPCGG